MFLYGKNSVSERLKVKPESIIKIFLQDNFDDLHIEKLIKEKRILTERLNSQKLYKIKPADNLQGIIAKVGDFTYAAIEDFFPAKDKSLTLIFLDRVYDPQNLGAIIRTAACFGGFALIIPKHKACEVNETALHVAQGAENHIPITMVSNLSNSIISAKKNGYWIIGAVTEASAKNLNEVPLPFPLGLVLGSEGEGVRYGVDKHLDVKARIPMKGAKISFNVSIASAIFCYEIDKQRG